MNAHAVQGVSWAIAVAIIGAGFALRLVRAMEAAELAQRFRQRWEIMIRVNTRFAERLVAASEAIRALSPRFADLRDAIGANRLATGFEQMTARIHEAEAETRPWLLAAPYSMADVRVRVQDLWSRAISRGAPNPTTRELYAQARRELQWEWKYAQRYDLDRSAAELGDRSAQERLEFRHALQTMPAALAALRDEAIRRGQERHSQIAGAWEWVTHGNVPNSRTYWRCTGCGTVRPVKEGVQPGGCCWPDDGEDHF